jgi:GNAT superfamily N-acetyltransferase
LSGAPEPAPRPIRPARPDEAAAISALAMRSKASNGYTDEQMEVFRRELALDPGDIRAHRAHVLVEEERIVAFYTLTARGDGAAELEHLFVEPARFGRGLGSALFRHACALARGEGFARVVIQSDPSAAGFYAALGARLERHVPSSIPGREIPLLSFPLAR